METLRVLVVDDEPNIRDLLSASLRFAGHQVATSPNGTDAISKIVDTQPDIVLLDVMLPDISANTHKCFTVCFTVSVHWDVSHLQCTPGLGHRGCPRIYT